MMQLDRWPGSPAARRGNREWDRRPAGDAPKPRGRVMAEHCARAAGKHGGEALSMGRKVGMADGVDPAIQTVQACGIGGACHRAPRVAQRANHLADRDDSVLSFRQFSQGAMSGLEAFEGFGSCCRPSLRSSFGSHSDLRLDRAILSPLPTPPTPARSRFDSPCGSNLDRRFYRSADGAFCESPLSSGRSADGGGGS